MSRGITGPFETWKEAVRYPCMRGDIASTAELTVHEPDDGVVHFAKWRPFAQNAVSRSAAPAPAREEDRVGIWGAGDSMAHSGAAGEQLPEAAQ
jgi:hypothetical protein